MCFVYESVYESSLFLNGTYQEKKKKIWFVDWTDLLHSKYVAYSESAGKSGNYF